MSCLKRLTEHVKTFLQKIWRNRWRRESRMFLYLWLSWPSRQNITHITMHIILFRNSTLITYCEYNSIRDRLTALLRRAKTDYLQEIFCVIRRINLTSSKKNICKMKFTTLWISKVCIFLVFFPFFLNFVTSRPRLKAWPYPIYWTLNLNQWRCLRFSKNFRNLRDSHWFIFSVFSKAYCRLGKVRCLKSCFTTILIGYQQAWCSLLISGTSLLPRGKRHQALRTLGQFGSKRPMRCSASNTSKEIRSRFTFISRDF